MLVLLLFYIWLLVADSKIQVGLISRKRVFVEVLINFLDNTLSVYCIMATFMASNVDLGLLIKDFFTHLSNNQDTYITFKLAHIEKTL